MGGNWRRYSEMARQKFHMVDKDFVPTPNTRNELMLREAGEFAAHLKRCEQDIANLKDSTEAVLNTTKIVLSAPLPRVYQDAGNGKAQPMVQGNRPPGLIGGEFDSEELGRVAKESGKKLDQEVLAPMQRWLTAYNTTVDRMKKLEALRLEVDSRRRTCQTLGRKVDTQRAKAPQGSAKGEIQLENTIKTLQHKEQKLTATRQTFKEHESIVYQQLSQLIRDAVWLKSYIVAVMRLAREAFASAYTAVGPVSNNPTMSMAQDSSYSVGAEYGALPSKPEPLPSSKDMAGYNMYAAAAPDPAPYGLEAVPAGLPAAPTHQYPVAAAPAAYNRYEQPYEGSQQQYGAYQQRQYAM